jgi:hypothetical protein
MTAENLAIDINDPLKPYHKLKGSNVLVRHCPGVSIARRMID